jgi:hypothetical protein
MNFPLTEGQLEKLDKWREEQDVKVGKMQEEKGLHQTCHSKPYYGASGGAYTYSFTPTTLGIVFSVTNNITKETIDLTEYDMW